MGIVDVGYLKLNLGTITTAIIVIKTKLESQISPPVSILPLLALFKH